MTSPQLHQPFKLLPCLSERPWGGRRLETLLNKSLPSQGRFGESWEIADHPDGCSMIAEGEFAGERFGELLRKYPRELCDLSEGPGRYPLLVKFLDVVDHLSLQVHPTDEHARLLGDRGKSECWYVMDCEEGAELILGLHEHASQESLFEALRLADPLPALDALVRRIPIHKGSFLHVPAGTVHAILGGCVICEVQQSSNLTYRLWDWNREPARAMHIEEGFKVIRFGPDAHSSHSDTHHLPSESVLVSNEHFEVRLAAFTDPEEAILDLHNPHGVVLSVVGGSGAWSMGAAELGSCGGHFHLGDTWYLPPAVKQLRITAGVSDLRLIISRSLELE